METVHIAWSRSISPAVLAERHAAFPGPAASGCDEFDAESVHVVMSVRPGDALAGYGRLTIGGPGVFNSWTRGLARLPAGPAVADLGRCFVAQAFRRRELFGPLCAAAMSVAKMLGCTVVNGACIPGRRVLATLVDIGFVFHGGPVDEVEPNGNLVRIQPLTCSDLELPEQALQRYEPLLAVNGMAFERCMSG